MADYENISNPYNSSLAREPGGLSFATGGVNIESGVTQQSQTPAQAGGNTAASSNTGGGPAQQASVASGGAIADITIEHSIQSKNWMPKKVGFYIDGQTGYAEFSNVFVSGDIQALTGTIGGWTINATTISASGITLDSAGSISSSNFVSGPLGAGWSINSTGTAEFQDAIIRGTIRTSVFEKDTISAVNGMVLISKADVLSSDMTALDASTLTISGQTTFVANEVIRIKDGTDDEWMLVTSAASAPTYTVTRDLAAAYTSNNNPIWKKGTAVVSMGVGTGTKTGFILLDSSSSNSPYIDIYGRNSNTYTDYTIHGRYGWLKGITDADVGLSATDVWGLYTDNAYIKGVIVANTGYIGGTTGWTIGANSITSGSGSTTVGLDNTVTAGDDVRIYAGSATAASAPFRVTESGKLTAVGVTTLNTQAYTSFETSGRFVQSVGNSGVVTFANQGMTVDTGATGASFARVLWNVSASVFYNSPTFSCTLLMNALNAATNSGVMYVGMGTITVAGTGHTFSAQNFCGFVISKASGTVSIFGRQGNGTTFNDTATLVTVINNDVVDLILKVNGTSSVDYYYRKNSNALSAATNLTLSAPTTTADVNVQFSIDNENTATQFQIVVYNASFQH